ATAKPRDFSHITGVRNREAGLVPLIDRDTLLRDFYYRYKEPTETNKEIKNRYENLEPASDSALKIYKDNFVYEIRFRNKGGLVMPLIVQFNYEDGTSEVERIGAYVWRRDEKMVTKTFLKK